VVVKFRSTFHHRGSDGSQNLPLIRMLA
jgi:hypothetical protein